MAELLLKWGTIKGWDFENSDQPKVIELMKEFFKDGVPMSCAMDKPDESRRQILCNIIDQFEGTIHNDWSGEDMTKDAAKKYVMEFGK